MRAFSGHKLRACHPAVPVIGCAAPCANPPSVLGLRAHCAFGHFYTPAHAHPFVLSAVHGRTPTAGDMILEAAPVAVAALAGVWALRQLAHWAILRGLRAPRIAHTQSPIDQGMPSDAVQAVRLAGPGGKQLFGWLISPSGARARAAPAVLVMHGWGANASLMGSVVPPLHTAGCAVLLLDARCHGQSDGEAFTSMPRFAEDIAAGLAWLRTQPGIAADRIALLGHSVGAAAALLHASRHHDVCAVVSLSAFAHPREVMRSFMAEKHVPYPVLGWYLMRHVQRVIGTCFDDIAPIHTIGGVHCPILLVHGSRDEIVPTHDAQRLLAASGHAQLLLVDADHDLRTALEAHGQTLVDFLHAACAVPVAAARA